VSATPGLAKGTGYSARTIPNVLAVARREFTSRARTRTFRLTTVILVLGGLALALAPILVRLVAGAPSGDRVEVIVGDSKPSIVVVAALGQILNANTASPASASPAPNPGGATAPRFIVEAGTDLAAARQKVVNGSVAAAIALKRNSAGDLAFDLYSKGGPLDQTALLLHQAVGTIDVQDKLNRVGVSPVDQQRLFTPPAFELLAADPNASPSVPGAHDNPALFLSSFALTIAIFMAIILYGQWIAYSVAEEKSSRVMEIVLAAATPFQLLSGKVLGVGSLAIFQYLVVSIPTIAALLFQGQIASAVLGGQASSIDFSAGISIPIMLTFGVMLILGFAIYATLYAGAASLVSRQEDINQIVAPLTIVSVVGYLVSTYAGTGLLDINSPVVIVLSFIPLFSPYLMLTRLSLGAAGPVEVLVAIALLLVAIPIALWVAARLYRSGVLMYGQSPSPRTLWRALRSG
jgi:ABC-2 type transport system permease protein